MSSSPRLSARDATRGTEATRLSRRRWEGVQDRALAIALLALTAGAAIAADQLGVPPVVVLALAAAPILVIVGSKHALAILPAAILVRAIVDNWGLLTTAGVAIGIIGLGLLVSWRSATWLLVLFGVSGALLLSAAYGAARFGTATSYGEALRLISALAVVLVVVNAKGRFTAVQIAWWVMLVGLVPALVAIYQWLTGTGTHIDGLLRASGTLAQSNPAAALFALCNLAAFALLMARAPRRGLTLIMFAIFLGAQAATGTISGAVTLLVMVIVYLLTLRHARVERIALVFIGIALVVYLAANSDIGKSRLAEFSGPGADPLSKDNSLGWRIEAWGKVLDAWHQHPVFGNGVGSTQAGIILVDNIPHNEYVRILAETGVVGLAFVLIVAGAYGNRMLRAVGTSDDFAPSFALAVLVGTFVNALAANTFLYSTTFYLTLFVLAACWRLTQDEGAAP